MKLLLILSVFSMFASLGCAAFCNIAGYQMKALMWLCGYAGALVLANFAAIILFL